MTTLIKNVNIIDGSGEASFRADVVIRNDKIVAIGSFSKYAADEVIDGLGGFLAPGFIDANNLSDLFLTVFSNPTQKDFLEQGVTSIIGGQNGISLAPVFLGNLELNRYFADVSKLNLNWRSVADFFDIIEKRKTGVNFATLVGYLTIRREIAGDGFRDLTVKEMAVFQHTLLQSLRQGAMGLSIDLSFPLASLLPFKEIKQIAELIKKYDAVLSIKIRNSCDSSIYFNYAKEHFLAAVSEIIGLASETGVKIQLNNFTCLKGLEKEYARALEMISENSNAADINFTYSHNEYSIINIFSLLPAWARRGGLLEIEKNVLSPDVASRIKNELPLLKGNEVVILDIPGYRYLSGKTLKDFSGERGMSVKEGVVELLRISRMRGTLFFKNISLKPEIQALTHDNSMIASAAAGFNGEISASHLFGYGRSFETYLKKGVSKDIMSLEAFINKMTGMPALRFGIKNRGFIKENYCADLVMFRDNGKIDYVMVNGKMAVIGGHINGTMAGKVIKHSNK